MDSIRDYKVSEEIGSGGMGRVYKAIHPGLRTTVIIKELSVKDSDMEKRFKREAKIMMNLRHDNIVPVHDYFIDSGKRYIVMEYVQGITLQELIERKGKLDPRIAVVIFSEVCRGLGYAHSKDVVHRDLKPSNILISRRGEVKIIDFGIAGFEEAEDEATKPALTRTGMFMGTPAYMSPEHFDDMKKVTGKSDIYSMGIIFYEMLTGEKPFGSGIAAHDVGKRLSERYRYSPKAGDIPSKIFTIIKKCLKPDPAKRYRNILQPLKAMERLYSGMTRADVSESIARYVFRNETADQLKKFKPIYSSLIRSFVESRRRKAAIITAASLAVLGGLVAIVLVNDLHRVVLQGNAVGRLEVRYELPLPRFEPLPDRNEMPGPYRKQAEEVTAALKKYIDDNYKNSLYKFELRAWLSARNTLGGREIETEELVLRPVNCVKTGGGDYTIDLGEGPSVPENLVLSGATLFRKAGPYSLKVVMSGQSYITHFTLDPIKTQKQPLVLAIQHKWTPRTKVSFRFSPVDENTGDGIDDMKIFVYLNRTWFDWKTVSSRKAIIDNLYNGNSYFFSFTHPDYKPVWWLRVDVGTDQTAVNLTLKMRKKE